MPVARDDTPGILEARRAHAEGREGLLNAIDHGAEVRDIADRVAEHGSRNHWGEILGATYLRRGGKQS